MGVVVYETYCNDENTMQLINLLIAWLMTLFDACFDMNRTVNCDSA